MGLFGKKKTPAEILEEGRSQYVKGDLKKAFLSLHGLAVKGNPQACWYVGRIYLERKERSLAQSFLTTAAKDGVQDAAALLAKEFGVRDYLPKETASEEDITADKAFARGFDAYNGKNYAEALKWWERAAQLGETAAQYNLGYMYHAGEGTDKNESTAFYWYRKSAEGGHPGGQYNTGVYYLYGVETPVNKEEALKWFRLAAEQGDENAKKQLAALTPKPDPKPAPKTKTDEELCDEGARAYAEKNYADAVQIWSQLAEKGMARAQDCLALLYYRGDGVEKDEKKAVEWYRKAAEQGRGNSCFNLAIFYERGIGVAEDLDEALRWAEKAKAAGAERADNLIAEIRHNIEVEKNRQNLIKSSEPKPGDELSPEERYRKGMELFQAGDYDGAFPLLKRTCPFIGSRKNKYPDGQAAIGWMYENGCGTEKSDTSARPHYRIAAQNGSRDGMAGMVRLIARKDVPSADECQTALEYAKQLGTSEAEAAVSTLEKKLSEAQLREKYAEWELNEANVQAIFNQCGKVNEDGSTTWDEEVLKKNKACVWYLLGQLDLVHRDVKEQKLDDAFFKRYNGDLWTENMGLVINLLNMGGMSEFCVFEEQDDNSCIVKRKFGLRLTFSPKDARFVDWFQSAEGYFIQGEIARMKMRDADALVFYEKAAEQGHADAQFQCGRRYHTGQGTAMDKEKALYWYEKAAQQGDGVAQNRLEELQTEKKALQGDAEAQYAYAERLEWSSEAEAFTFYLKAAQQGHRDAQYKAGKCFAFGKGIGKENNEALKWLQAAAKQGHKKADTLSNLMCKKGLFETKAADLEEAISKMIDRYETLSDSEKNFLIEFYRDFSDDLKDKFNHAQAKSLRKLANSL